jgi:hypothetical protein
VGFSPRRFFRVGEWEIRRSLRGLKPTLRSRLLSSQMKTNTNALLRSRRRSSVFAINARLHFGTAFRRRQVSEDGTQWHRNLVPHPVYSSKTRYPRWVALAAQSRRQCHPKIGPGFKLWLSGPVGLDRKSGGFERFPVIVRTIQIHQCLKLGIDVAQFINGNEPSVDLAKQELQPQSVGH